MRKILFPLLVLMGLAPYAAQAQQPEQDCINGIPVCNYFYNQTNAYLGQGAYPFELTTANQGCLGSGEKNDVWYIVNVTTTGTLGMTITPNNLNNDYDFAVYDISNGGCNAIFNYTTGVASTMQPIGCNYSGVSGTTGLSNTITGSQWSPALNVTPGMTLAVNVSNFSTSQQGYTLDFGPSTASIVDTVKPKFVSVLTQCQFSGSVLNVLMSEPVKCTSIAANGSQFYITQAGSINVIAAAGVNCTSGPNATTKNISLTLSSVLLPGTYWLHSDTSTNGQPLIDACSNAQKFGADSIQFTIVAAIPPQMVYVDTPACIKARIHFNRGIKCATIAPNGSDFSISGPGAVGIKKALPVGCSVKGLTDTVDVYFNSAIFTPGTYTISVKNGTDGNAVTDTCNLVVNNTVTFVVSDQGYVYTTATPAVLCAPGYVQLSSVVTTGPPRTTVSCGVNGTTCSTSPADYLVGNSTATGTVTRTPFYGFYMDARTRMIFRASELQAAGLGNGTITKLALNITSKLSTQPYNNFTIKMGCVSDTSLTDFNPNLPVVYTPKSYTSVVGTNVFNLDNTYDWDGTSNIEVEICYHNTSYTQNDAVQTTTTGLFPGATIHNYQDNGQGCSLANTGFGYSTGATRPNVTFSQCIPPPGVLTYLWTPSVLIGDTTAANTLAFAPQTSTYQLQIQDSNFCYRRSKSTVIVSVRNPQILSHDTAICIGYSIPLHVTGGLTYQWFPAEGLSCTDCADPIATPTQTTTYYVSIADQYGCSDTLKQIIIVNPLPIVDAGRDTSIVFGTPLQLYANAPGGMFYLWEPGTWLNNPIAPNPIATPQISTTYVVFVTDTNQCKSQDTIRVAVIRDIPVFVPSGFTPNGDGHNDVFKVANLTFQRVQEFRVQNRWGEEIFSAQDNRGWDGTYKGVPQDGGVYHYLIRVAYPDGQVKTYHGDVTLIR